MSKKKNLEIYLLSMAFKFVVLLFFTSPLVASLYSLMSFCFYSFYAKGYKYFKVLPIIIVDYVAFFYLCHLKFDSISYVILMSSFGFLLSNGCLYAVLISEFAKYSSYKNLQKISNDKVDLGLKALENQNYDEAIECFKKAIKEHKENYLGYLGMCNTLEKMNDKDLKQLKKYKKKCLKYAPKELKEQIDNKYE